MRRLAILLLSLAACSKPVSEEPERWSLQDCRDGGNIYFWPNGTYREVGGCRGQWSRTGDALLIGERCPMSFLTTDPLPIMGFDEDGRLPIVAPNVVEAQAGGLTKPIRRCS